MFKTKCEGFRHKLIVLTGYRIPEASPLIYICMIFSTTGEKLTATNAIIMISFPIPFSNKHSIQFQ